MKVKVRTRSPEGAQALREYVRRCGSGHVDAQQPLTEAEIRRMNFDLSLGSGSVGVWRQTTGEVELPEDQKVHGILNDRDVKDAFGSRVRERFAKADKDLYPGDVVLDVLWSDGVTRCFLVLCHIPVGEEYASARSTGDDDRWHNQASLIRLPARTGGLFGTASTTLAE